MLRTISRFSLGAFVLVTLSVSARGQSNLTAKANVFERPSPNAFVESDRSRDGLVGPVRRVRTEIAKLSNQNGRLLEGKHAVLEIVAYDIKGNKIENQYFPIAGANLTGKELYQYDEKGNISEMTLVNDDGSLLSKELYKYEFDFAGNWNKMTTSVAVIEAGRMYFEPTEITYRSIMYYLDEKMLKMAQPASPTAAPANNMVAITTVDTKSAAARPENSKELSSSQKSAIGIPTSMITADNVNTLGSVEGANTSATSTTGFPMIQLDSEPPPPPAPKPILRPISGGVLNGRAISLPSPIYPDSAKRLRQSGVVAVEVVVDETGKVISAHPTSGPINLREVAVQAALKARFSPTKLSGQPVKVSGVINYKFALAQ